MDGQCYRLGGGRTPEIMRQLLEADNAPDRMGNTRYVMARQDGTTLAYCLDTDHGIVEWGGPAELVAGLVRAWFAQRVGKRGERLAHGSQEEVLASQELTLAAPAAGHPFTEILRSLALPGHHDYWGMLYIIDPRGILDSFGRPEIAVREADGQFTLTRADESISVTGQGLAKLLFRPDRTSDFARDALPLLFWEWPTEHV